MEKAAVHGTHTSADPTCQSLTCLSSPISHMALQGTGRREAAPPSSSTTGEGPRHWREGGGRAWAPARGGKEKAELTSMEKGRSRRLLYLIFPRSGKERSRHPPGAGRAARRGEDRAICLVLSDLACGGRRGRAGVGCPGGGATAG